MFTLTPGAASGAWREERSRPRIGEPIVENQNYVIDNPVEFSKELNILREEYREFSEEYAKKDKELAEEEVDINFYVLDPINCPDDLDGNELEYVMYILKPNE